MITLKTGLYIVTWDKEDEMRKAVARQCYQCTIIECEILDECSYSVKKKKKEKKSGEIQSYYTKLSNQILWNERHIPNTICTYSDNSTVKSQTIIVIIWPQNNNNKKDKVFLLSSNSNLVIYVTKYSNKKHHCNCPLAALSTCISRT